MDRDKPWQGGEGGEGGESGEKQDKVLNCGRMEAWKRGKHADAASQSLRTKTRSDTGAASQRRGSGRICGDAEAHRPCAQPIGPTPF